MGTVISKIDGVIEIYTDATKTLSAMEHKQIRVAGVVLATLGLFYAVLYAFIAHAEKILNRQRKEHRHATELSSRLGRLLGRSIMAGTTPDIQ